MFTWLGLQAIADMFGFSAGVKQRKVNAASAAVPESNSPDSTATQPGFNIVTFIQTYIIWIIGALVIIGLIKTKKIKL